MQYLKGAPQQPQLHHRRKSSGRRGIQLINFPRVRLIRRELIKGVVHDMRPVHSPKKANAANQNTQLVTTTMAAKAAKW